MLALIIRTNVEVLVVVGVALPEKVSRFIERPKQAERAARPTELRGFTAGLLAKG